MCFLPFICKSSVNFDLIKKSKLDVNVVYDTCKMGSLFPLKSQTPNAQLANVFYKYTCKTKRHLLTRVNEHGNFDIGDMKTSIASHMVDC